MTNEENNDNIPRIIILKKNTWDKLEEIHKESGIGRQVQVRQGVKMWIEKYEEEKNEKTD